MERFCQMEFIGRLGGYAAIASPEGKVRGFAANQCDKLKFITLSD